MLYALVVWLAGRHGETAELGDPEPAPDDAQLEPLGRTALTAAGALIVFVAAGALFAELFDLLAIVLVLAAGVGLDAARRAARYAAWERRHPGRLVRDPANRLRVF